MELLNPLLRKLRILVGRKMRKTASRENAELPQELNGSHRRPLELESAVFENGVLPTPVTAAVHHKTGVENAIDKVTFIQNDDGSVLVTAFNGFHFDPPQEGILMGPFTSISDASC